MDPRLRALCVTLVLASCTRRAGAGGPLIRCEPCDAAARLLCKPLPADCAEPLREPGCGCCLSCALSAGQPCGVYTGRCGAGLSCRQRPGEPKPLQALLDGRGVCAPALRSTAVNEPPGGSARREERNASGSALRPSSGPSGPPRVFLSSAKLDVLLREQKRRTQSFKTEDVPGRLGADQHNFSVETKRQPHNGPCRREMESVLSGLKISNGINPPGFRIPNCDKKGFYKKKQCRPSKGRKRGFCWSVDKYGQPLPGFEGKERGDAQ